jgi:Family of unknown function (DUF6644)
MTDRLARVRAPCGGGESRPRSDREDLLPILLPIAPVYPDYRLKILTLGPAIAFALTIRRRVASVAEEERSRAVLALTAVTSLARWFTVAAAGRWIGFS